MAGRHRHGRVGGAGGRRGQGIFGVASGPLLGKHSHAGPLTHLRAAPRQPMESAAAEWAVRPVLCVEEMKNGIFSWGRQC